MAATPAKDALGRAVDTTAIEPLLARIVAELRPLEVRLFGSRARGDAAPLSDWDLFVIVPDDLAATDDIFTGYRLRRETHMRADVVLCPLSELAEDRVSIMFVDPAHELRRRSSMIHRGVRDDARPLAAPTVTSTFVNGSIAARGRAAATPYARLCQRSVDSSVEAKS